MAVIEIVRYTDGSSGLHPDQKAGEVHCFSDTSKEYSHGWKNCRVGSPYMRDGYLHYPFFVNEEEVRMDGFSCIEIPSINIVEPDSGKTIDCIRIWFQKIDVDNTEVYLSDSGLSVEARRKLKEEMEWKITNSLPLAPILSVEARRALKQLRGRIQQEIREHLATRNSEQTVATHTSDSGPSGSGPSGALYLLLAAAFLFFGSIMAGLSK